MRKIAVLVVAAVALLAGPALQAKERLTGEQQLAKLLEGRVAGEPVSCIPLSRTSDTRVIDGTAIVYDRGGTIYVNRPRDARSLDSDDVMVINIHGSQLCRMDLVRMHDQSQHFFTGFVGLEDFVPYRRVARAKLKRRPIAGLSRQEVSSAPCPLRSARGRPICSISGSITCLPGSGSAATPPSMPNCSAGSDVSLQRWRSARRMNFAAR